MLSSVEHLNSFITLRSVFVPVSMEKEYYFFYVDKFHLNAA